MRIHRQGGIAGDLPRRPSHEPPRQEMRVTTGGGGEIGVYALTFAWLDHPRRGRDRGDDDEATAMVEGAVPRLRRRTGSPELLAEEEMSFFASDVSGRERKKEGVTQAVQGGAPLLDGQQAVALGQPWRMAHTRRQGFEAGRHCSC
jgi:hypothetical protein